MVTENMCHPAGCLGGGSHGLQPYNRDDDEDGDLAFAEVDGIKPLAPLMGRSITASSRATPSQVHPIVHLKCRVTANAMSTFLCDQHHNDGQRGYKHRACMIEGFYLR
jgi:hypothetical protein